METLAQSTLNTANIKSNGVSIAQKPSVANVDSGITSTVGGSTVTGGTTTTPPGGGGGGGPAAGSVSAISITTSPADVSGMAYDAGAVAVSLSTSTQGAAIYYTTDGTAPTTSSAQYTAPFTVNNPGGFAGGTVTVKAIGVKAGMSNSAVAQKVIVYNAATAVTVSDITEFVTALETDSVGTVTLGRDITGDVTATRTGTNNFAVNFGAYVLVGNLSITANSVTGITFNGSAAPAITGNLAVTAANATINNGISAGGTITVGDVGNHSWVEQADGNRIILTDSNGATIVIEGNPEDITVEDGSNGINITANSPVTITVNSGDINVAGNGTVGTFGTASQNVTGTVAVVTGISSNLGVDQAEIRIGAVTAANITGVAAGEGESLNVTSANPAIVSVNNPSGLAITANTPGRTAITVKVKNANNEVIKQGTIFIAVLPAEISAASATIVAPAAGAAPQTASQIENATGNADYTVTSVSWNEALTTAGKFKSGQVYIANVVLTSKNSKAFRQGAFNPTVELYGSYR